MSIFARPVSEIYSNPPNQVVDVAGGEHYGLWGYTFAYEIDQDGHDIPQEGNTGLYRIEEECNTEPVFVLPKENSKFTLTTLLGEGVLVTVRPGGAPQISELCPEHPAHVTPNTAYFLVNTGKGDLLVKDEAVPAFQQGDDVELTRSQARPSQRPQPRNNDDVYAAVITAEGPRNIQLPAGFFDIFGDVAKGDFKVYR